MTLAAILIALLTLGSATAGPLDERKLVPPSSVPYQEFGYDVALNDSWSLVSAPASLIGVETGVVHVYDTTSGNYLHPLTSTSWQHGDIFGWSIALSGSTALVHAYEERPLGVPGGGSAVYLFDVATGGQLHRVAPTISSQYGYSPAVDIDGSLAIVGTDAGPSDSDFRAVLIDAVTGTEVRQFKSVDHTAGASTWSVALSGNVAIVGSPRENSSGENSGAAYLFDVATGTQLARLTSSDASAGSYFGWSVDIEGDYAIVGSPGFNSGVGAAYVFDVPTGSELYRLTATDTQAFDLFGDSVSISGWNALVGAPNAGVQMEGAAGAAYVFDLRDATERIKLIASDDGFNDFLGESAALFGNKALLGGYFENQAVFEPGTAYLYTLPIPEPGNVVVVGVALTISLSYLKRRRGPSYE